MKKCILSVAYDESLLLTRKLILEQAGFEVTSALGFTAASAEIFEQRQFDLVMLGHTLPARDKSALIALVRKHCRCPVLSIRRYGQPPHPEADYSVDSAEGPEALIEAVQNALKSEPLAPAS